MYNKFLTHFSRTSSMGQPHASLKTCSFVQKPKGSARYLRLQIPAKSSDEPVKAGKSYPAALAGIALIINSQGHVLIVHSEALTKCPCILKMPIFHKQILSIVDSRLLPLNPNVYSTGYRYTIILPTHIFCLPKNYFRLGDRYIYRLPDLPR